MDLFDSLRRSLNTANDDDQDGVFTSEEIQALIISLAKSRGERGFTEEECFEWIKWAQSQRIGSSIVDLVIKGYVDVHWEGSEPTFTTSELGKMIANELKGTDRGSN